MKVLINFIMFQAVWLASVLGAAAGYWWAGPAALLVFLVVHNLWGNPLRSDLLMVLTLAVVGFFIDTGFVVADLLVFAQPVPSPSVAPIWIVSMWMSFALTLNHSLRWLDGRMLVAAAFGGIGGALAYFAASRFDAVSLAEPTWVPLLVIGLAWTAASPFAVSLASRWRRQDERATAATTEPVEVNP